MSARLVQHYVAESARTAPAKVAACGGPDDEAVTYADLEAGSNRIAHCLRDSGVARQERAILCMARSPRSVCAMLGVLKADAVYVPLAPAQPAVRSRRILEDCDPAAIVCDAAGARSLLPLAREVAPKARVLVLGGAGAGDGESAEGARLCERDVDACSSEAPATANIDRDLAYILYTSGSTGRPKGVMISHANIRHYIDWAVDFVGIRAEDELLSTAPFEFDMSTFDIYCAQKAGATLHIIPDELVIFPTAMLDFMEAHGITVWKGASSLLLHLDKLGALTPERVPLLRAVLFGGDRLPAFSLIRWMETFPEKRFYNAYGPTEATGVSACCLISTPPADARAAVPVGRPRAGTELVIIDEDGRPAPAGAQGELCIGGAGVSRGYWGDDDKTRRAFIPHPVTGDPRDPVHKTGDLAFQGPDGNFHLVGRKDDQVKIRGYRVTLGEIGAELSSLPDVLDAALVMSARGDEPELVAAVELRAPATPADVQRLLKGRLPHYMVPARIVAVDAVPRNERGKPDRDRLLRLVQRPDG